MSFRIQRGAILPGQESIQKPRKVDGNFEGILKEKIGQTEDVKLSSHAQKRLTERQIHLHKGDINKLTDAMDKLDDKGAKESLMIYKDMAFIASVKNRTIITAMGSADLDIVTNIDSTIIIK